jgi:hypothetical protein
MIVEFELPGVTPSLNVWMRMWRHKWQAMTTDYTWEVRAHKPRTWPIPPPAKVKVTIVRVGKQLLDDDNLANKALIDSLKHAGFIADDDRKHIDLIETQEQGSRPHRKIRLEIL